MCLQHSIDVYKRQALPYGVSAGAGSVSSTITLLSLVESSAGADVYKRQIRRCMTLFTAIKNWLHRLFGKTEEKTVQPVFDCGEQCHTPPYRAFPAALIRHKSYWSGRDLSLIHICLNTLQTRLGSFDTIRVDTKGQIFGLDKTVVSSGPVSYTHLDVYKRQRDNRAYRKKIYLSVYGFGDCIKVQL